MKIAIIENGKVVNIAVYEEMPEGGILAEGAKIGDTYENGVFTSVEEPKTVEQLKAEREAAVSAIKVTTAAGNTYDGDEVSINRMTAAITVLMATGGAVPWVLADNSIVTVSAAELTEALALSAAEVARLWVLPYAG